MGTARHARTAVAIAALVCAAPRQAWSSTVAEPIARLSLEGGYDSNALYEGKGADRMGRVSPELGFLLHDHRYELRASYAGDWVTYAEREPGGIWNHRALLTLESRATRRLELTGLLRGGWAFDPIGLAQLGVFRTGRSSAFLLDGRGRAEYRVTRRIDGAVAFQERTVVFEDGTGGAMHAPSVEALWRRSERLSLGGGYTLGIFQDIDDAASDLASSNALKARARYRLTRRLTLNAATGPAIWVGGGDVALVPEASVELLGSSRFWDVRASASRGLGIGSTAAPGLVTSAELGAVRRFGRRFDLRGDGGLWHSGRAPSGGDAVLGYAVAGEAGVLFGGGVRLALAATHFARVDDPSAALRRTTVGLRLGWELPVR